MDLTEVRQHRSRLDERGRRRWPPVKPHSLGRGGTTAVAVATGISDRTIRNGIRELNDPNPLPPTRRRRPGGGRKSRTHEQPGLVAALEKLVESDSRGDPQSPLRWTCKSTRSLARALKAGGFAVSRTKVGQLLKSSGFSLQSNRKIMRPPTTRIEMPSLSISPSESRLDNDVVNLHFPSIRRRRKCWDLSRTLARRTAENGIPWKSTFTIFQILNWAKRFLTVSMI